MLVHQSNHCDGAYRQIIVILFILVTISRALNDTNDRQPSDKAVNGRTARNKTAGILEINQTKIGHPLDNTNAKQSFNSSISALTNAQTLTNDSTRHCHRLQHQIQHKSGDRSSVNCSYHHHHFDHHHHHDNRRHHHHHHHHHPFLFVHQQQDLKQSRFERLNHGEQIIESIDAHYRLYTKCRYNHNRLIRSKRATFTFHDPRRQLPLLSKDQTKHFLSLFGATLQLRNITDPLCERYYLCRVFDIAVQRTLSYPRLADIELALLDVFGKIENSAVADNPTPERRLVSKSGTKSRTTVPRHYYDATVNALRGFSCPKVHPCRLIPAGIDRQRFDRIPIGNRFAFAHPDHRFQYRQQQQQQTFGIDIPVGGQHNNRFRQQYKRRKIERYQVSVHSLTTIPSITDS